MNRKETLGLGALHMALLLMGFTACQPKAANQPPDNSQLKYGFLDDRAANLLELSPDEEILVCGTNERNLRALTFESVKTWAIAAGRSDIKVEQLESCANKRIYAASIETVSKGPGCKGNILGYTRASGNHHQTVSCPFAQQSLSASTMLHEVGHNWGLCDQYDQNDPGRIIFHGNCQSEYKSKQAGRSIMGGGSSASPRDLTADDKLGIRIGACRADIRANKIWLNRHPEVLSSWNTPEFKTEISRLAASGADFLDICRTLSTPIPTPIPTPTLTPAPAPVTIDPLICQHLAQKVTKGTHIQQGLQEIIFWIAASTRDLEAIESVTYPIQRKFAEPLTVTDSAGSFATSRIYTNKDGWSSMPATVVLKNKESCTVPGTLISFQ